MSDLISRQAAIDLVRDVCDAILSGCGSHYDGEDEVYDDLLEVDAILKCNKEIRIALANMPSAQPERKKGKWTYIKNVWVNHSVKICRCSVCNRPSYGAMDFCSRCGADMRGKR